MQATTIIQKRDADEGEAANWSIDLLFSKNLPTSVSHRRLGATESPLSSSNCYLMVQQKQETRLVKGAVDLCSKINAEEKRERERENMSVSDSFFPSLLPGSWLHFLLLLLASSKPSHCRCKARHAI